MVDYSGYGNERLLPLGVAGDQDAIDELGRRGNTIMPDGSLEKVYTTTVRNASGGSDVIERTVNMGRLIKKTVNGKEVRPDVPGMN